MIKLIKFLLQKKIMEKTIINLIYLKYLLILIYCFRIRILKKNIFKDSNKKIKIKLMQIIIKNRALINYYILKKIKVKKSSKV